MSYTGNGYMLGGFFDGISSQNSAEALAEAMIDQIDNAVFRDTYMDTMNEALDNGVDYLDRYDEEGNYAKESIEDAIIGLGADIDDIDIDPGYATESYAPESDEYEYAMEGTDCALQNCIDKLPDGDPSEAGTYFSLVNKVNAEGDPEARDAIKEQLDMISVYVPDTDIVTEDASTADNEFEFSNGRDKKDAPATKQVTNKDGNVLVQGEDSVNEEGFVADEEMLALEDLYSDPSCPSITYEEDNGSVLNGVQKNFQAGSNLVKKAWQPGIDLMKKTATGVKSGVQNVKDYFNKPDSSSSSSSSAGSGANPVDSHTIQQAAQANADMNRKTWDKINK